MGVGNTRERDLLSLFSDEECWVVWKHGQQKLQITAREILIPYKEERKTQLGCKTLDQVAQRGCGNTGAFKNFSGQAFEQHEQQVAQDDLQKSPQT